MKNARKQLQIVLDLEMTLIFATLQKPDRAEDKNYIVVHVSV